MNKVEEMKAGMREAALAQETADLMHKITSLFMPIMFEGHSRQAVLLATAISVAEEFKKTKIDKEIKDHCFEQMIDLMRMAYASTY